MRWKSDEEVIRERIHETLRNEGYQVTRDVRFFSPVGPISIDIVALKGRGSLLIEVKSASELSISEVMPFFTMAKPPGEVKRILVTIGRPQETIADISSESNVDLMPLDRIEEAGETIRRLVSRWPSVEARHPGPVYDSMISQATGTLWANVHAIITKRGMTFRIEDAKPYVEAVGTMVPVYDQSKEVFDLHVQSVNAHFEILKGLTDTVRPEDEPFVDHYQTGPILTILREEDPEFDKSVRRFIDAIGKNEALIGREAVRIYGGFYGPIAIVDFAFSPGSANIVNRILRPLDIPKAHKETILASKSFGMNTSYVLGGPFQAALEAGKSVAEAVLEEVRMFQFTYDQPVVAQNQIMATRDFSGRGPHASFDTDKYQKQYMEWMRPVVKAALAASVHPANIICVPVCSIGDIGHVISQSMFNFAKDPIVAAIMKAHAGVLDKTLRHGLEQGYKSEYHVLSVAIGTAAACFAYELARDYSSAASIMELLSGRLRDIVLGSPSPLAKLYEADFMTSLWRGLEIVRPKSGGSRREIGGVEIDFGPIDTHPDLRSILRGALFSSKEQLDALLGFANFPSFLKGEPVSPVVLTHIIALHKGRAVGPLRYDGNLLAAQPHFAEVS